jgi:hypothetical protein
MLRTETVHFMTSGTVVRASLAKFGGHPCIIVEAASGRLSVSAPEN